QGMVVGRGQIGAVSRRIECCHYREKTRAGIELAGLWRSRRGPAADQSDADQRNEKCEPMQLDSLGSSLPHWAARCPKLQSHWRERGARWQNSHPLPTVGD